MSLILFDPVGEVQTETNQKRQRFDTLNGAKVGYVFNQHVSALNFWKTLREEIEKTLAPSHSLQIDKAIYTAPAAVSDIENVAKKADYALVGVGA